MAQIAYPGDITDGDDVDAASINDRVRPLYKTLNASGISGADGIADDEVPDGALSPAKTAGTAMTLDDSQTATGDKDFNGETALNGETLCGESGKVRHFGVNSDGANGGSSTNDTTPDASGIVRMRWNYDSATNVTALDNPTDGQILFITNIGSNVTLVHKNGGGTGDILTQDGANLTLVAGELQTVMLMAVDDGTQIYWSVL